MDITGKTALVTGAGKRVGRAIALQLAASGANIIIHYNTSSRESDQVAVEVMELGRQATTIRGNLENPDAIAAMISELDRVGLQVDILVNSASIYEPAPLPDVTVDMWDRILNVNLRAPFLLAQALGLRMKERGFGRIINIADCNVRRVYRDYTPYLVSKAGLTTLTETLALELSPEVTVNAIAPGTVLVPDDASQEFKDQALRRSPLQRYGTPEDIAHMVNHLVIHGQFITGTTITVDGGATIR